MKRRKFVELCGLASAASLVTPGMSYAVDSKKDLARYSRYRGFNLLEKLTGTIGKYNGPGPRLKFQEEDFEIMAEWGFNFARIPMAYWQWASPENWYSVNEDVLKDIDEVVEFGKQYNVHIDLNLHRIPGYCINGVFWDRDYLGKRLIDPWKPLMGKGVAVHVGEWGCYNKTPHDVALRWMRDLLSLWKEVRWGALWNLKGTFGVLDSERSDVAYERYKRHLLDRKMLEMLQEN